MAIYLVAILLGLLTGMMAPLQARSLEGVITPVLAGLLYVTFLQVPLTDLRRALTHTRFLSALLSANFLVVPLLARLPQVDPDFIGFPGLDAPKCLISWGGGWRKRL